MSTQMSSDAGSTVTETTVDDGDVGRTVVAAVAERTGVPTTDVEEQLYDVVDPDALEQLVAGAGGTDAPAMRVSFAYAGFGVTVTGDGTVTLAAT